jgi:hypothetical protein
MCTYFLLIVIAQQDASHFPKDRIIKSRWTSLVALMADQRNAYRLLVGKPEGKGRLGRPRRWWVNNIRTDLGDVGWGDVDCIGLAQDRKRWRALVNSVLNLQVP